MQDRERREGGILLLVQPELSKCCSLQRLGMRSDRVWEGLGVPGSDRSPSSGSSIACRHRSLPPAARALRVIKNEIRIEVLHTHTHMGCGTGSPAKSMLLEGAQELLQC